MRSRRNGLPLCKNLAMSDHDQKVREELAILEALVTAIDRRDEVFQVVDDSDNSEEAIRRVGQLLDVGSTASRFVLDMQLRRFTRDQRQALATRMDELKSALSDGR